MTNISLIPYCDDLSQTLITMHDANYTVNEEAQIREMEEKSAARLILYNHFFFLCDKLPSNISVSTIL